MSTNIATVKTTGRNGDADLVFTEFSSRQGCMLQITQGLGTQINNDTPGFIQLTPRDAYLLLQKVALWLKNTAHEKAKKLEEQIERDTELKKTIFQDAVECEHFIADLKLIEIPLQLLGM